MPRDWVVLVSLARHALLDSVCIAFGGRETPDSGAPHGGILLGSEDWSAVPCLGGGQVAILRLDANFFDVISVSYSPGGDLLSSRQPASSMLDGYSALFATDALGTLPNRTRGHAAMRNAAMVIRDTIPLVSLHLE
jgi:hypothetical protein